MSNHLKNRIQNHHFKECSKSHFICVQNLFGYSLKRLDKMWEEYVYLNLVKAVKASTFFIIF